MTAQINMCKIYYIKSREDFMRYNNFIPIEKFSFRYKYFFFIDTKSYLADALFIKHKVRVWFKQEYCKEKNEFVFIFCKVRKNDVEKFTNALEELKDKMLLLGHSNYQDFCEKFNEDMLALRREA